MLSELIAIVVILISAIIYFIFPGGNVQTRSFRDCRPMTIKTPSNVVQTSSVMPVLSGDMPLNTTINPADNNCIVDLSPRTCLRQTPFIFEKSYGRVGRGPKKILRSNDMSETRVRVANTNKRVSFNNMRLERHILGGGQIKEFYSRI